MLAEDKKRHFIVAFFLGIVAFIFSPRILVPAVWAFLGAALIGFEIYQKITGTGVFEWADIIMGILGLTIALIAAITLNRMPKNDKTSNLNS